MWSKISAYFFQGLVTLLPLFVTVWLLWFMFSFLDSIFGGIITLIARRPIPGLGFAITIVLIFFAGLLTSRIFGERLIKFAEQQILYRLPIIKSIYSSIKQVNDVLFIQKEEKEFRRACLVEYPRKGIYTVGFVTREAAAEVETKAHTKLVNIFIPNTPTPATGFLIAIPADEVKLLEMKVEDAFKYVVSGGVLQP